MDQMQKTRMKSAATLFAILFSAFLTINCALWELLTADMDAVREATQAVIQQQTNDAQMTVDALKTREKEYEQTQHAQLLYDVITSDAVRRLTNSAKTHAASTKHAEMMWTWSAEEYAKDMARTPSSTPSRPIILDIEFPATIPGDGTTSNGELSFADDNGDINRLTIEVIRATEFGGADYDPTGYIIDGNNYGGTIKLFIWCKGSQTVTLRATLYDWAGLKSNSMDFSFTCQ